MEKKFKLDLSKGIIFILISTIIILLFMKKDYSSKITNPYLGTVQDSGLPLGDTITCEFPEESVFSIEDGTNFITHKSAKASKPTILTFINIDSSKPQLKGNLDTVDLISINRSPTTIVLAEKSEMGNLSFYTIFPKNKVAVWQKAYSILDSIPFSLNSMGYCY